MRSFFQALKCVSLATFLFVTIPSFGQSNLVSDDVEFQALKDLYTSTLGATWKVKTSWPTTWPATATATQMDAWYGIVVTNGDITGISLPNNTLKGTLPASIGNLTALTSLNLSSNQIGGSIPTAVGSLTNLSVLNFTSNNFSGNIPTQVGTLVNLTDLQLSYNALTGAIPDFCALTKLVTLKLNNNVLSSSIPACLSGLPVINILDLSSNTLTGSIPTFSSNTFTTIDLSLNSLSGAIPSLNGMSELTTFDVSRNLLTAFPSNFQGLTKLTTFYAYQNKITGSIPPSLGNFTTLVNLNLQDNLLSGSLPSELGALNKLKLLSLHTNQLTGTIPLTYSGLTSIETITLANNDLSGAMPNFIGDLTTLKSLSLNGNEFSGDLPTVISKLTNLTALYLSDNNFTGRFPEEYGNLVNLTHLYVDQNRLEGELPRLTSLTKLQYLFLSKNYFRGSVPVTYSAFTDIRSFYIDNNYLSGDFPSIFNNWTKVTLINLSGNKFTGIFPTSIGNCVALSVLNASHNEFTSVPASVLTLPAFVNLNVRANKLTSIPDFTNYARAAALTLSVQNNQLGLDKIETLYNQGGTTSIKSLIAYPQIFNATRMDVPAGKALLIVAASKGSGSILWEKLSGTTWNSVNALNEDATQQTFQIALSNASHEGQYRWRATTPKMSTWATQSEPITVTIVDAIPTTTTAQKMYNGLITSVRWRTNKAYDSKGTDLEGIYLYDYDDKYQIKDARFGKVNWTDSGQAYSTYQLEGNKYRLSGMSYDPNGNIQTLHRFNEKGERTNNFTYHYIPNTNKLDKVDGYTTKYAYDEIGRMTKADKETGEDQYVDYDVTGKVTMVYADEAKTIKKVEYQYDDHGFRLAKVVFAPPGSSEPSKTTWYIRDASGSVTSIYEQEGVPSAENPDSTFIIKEIPIYGSGKLGTYYPQEDGSVAYELTDHLGNVRALVRDDVKIYRATMEDTEQFEVTNPRVQEENYFLNITATEWKYAPMNHTSQSEVEGAEYSAYLKWQSGMPGNDAADKAIGPAIALKVSAGDEIKSEVFVRYREKTSYPRNGFTMSVLSSILGGHLFGANGFEGSTLSQTAQAFNSALTAGGFLSDNNSNDLPHAYLNYIVLDGNKNLIASDYRRVTEAGGFETSQEGLPDMHERLAFDQPIVIPTNGQYIFIWVSNESEMTDVWFDDLMISHKTKFVKEATDYGVWGDVLRTSSNDEKRKSIKDNLIAQYDLDGNATDTGGRGLNGTVTGAVPSVDQHNEPNKAYAFDGIDDKISIAGADDDVSFIPNTSVFTISVFVKIDNLDKRNVIISNTLSSLSKGFSLTYENNDATLRRLRFTSTVGQSTRYNEVIGNYNTIDDTDWHHVLVVGDGSAITLYVDGYVDAYSSGVLYYTTGNSVTPLLIGNSPTINTAFKGSIDEVKIFDRALTDAEIRLLANEKTLAEVDYVLNDTEKYRYGYQGQFAERDEETGWNHFELREYDPIVGRWTSKDPAGQFYSPFVGMGNNPVSGTDPDGAWVWGAGLWNNLTKSDSRIYSEMEAETMQNDVIMRTNGTQISVVQDNGRWGVFTFTPDGHRRATVSFTPVDGDGNLGTQENDIATWGPAPGTAEFDPMGQLMLVPLVSGTANVINRVAGWTTAETLSLEGAVWAQKTFSASFSLEGNMSGFTVDEIATGLRSGAIPPSMVPLDVIVRNGKTFILNTRSSASLIRAGIPQTSWKIVNQTGVSLFENNLTKQLIRNRSIGGFETIKQSGTQMILKLN